MVWNYHQQRFPFELRSFFESLYKGPRHRNIGDGVVRNPRTHFHCCDLEMDPVDHLESIQQPAFFAVSLTYTVLVNQIFHCHFSERYSLFFADTQYPNIAGGMNPSTSPYHILHRVK